MKTNRNSPVSELICLSSSDEEPSAKNEPRDNSKEESQPKRRRIAPSSVANLNEVVCLDSEDDEDSQDLLMVTKVEKVEMPDLEPEKEEPLIETMMCDSTSDKTLTIEKSEINKMNENDEIISKIEDLPPHVIAYLNTSKKSLGEGNIEIFNSKFPKLIKMFRELANEFRNSKYLINFLKQQTELAAKSTRGAIISFKDVYIYLKTNLKDEGIELSEKDRKRAKKLKKMMDTLLEKLKELDEAEVDFGNEDEENDSNYIKQDAYSKRLCKVYNKYCKILSINPYAGRLTHEQLKFVSSNYQEINMAITKKFRNNSLFPNYGEFSSYIQKVVEESGLQLSPSQLKCETDICFEKLGDLLQTRRKKDLYEAHCTLILDKEDPADKDQELDKKLRSSYKKGKVKIEQIYEEYVRKQETSVDDEEHECKTDEDEEGDEKEID